MEAPGGLAPYRIDAEIAHSSICTIYRAYEENLGRPVLIKKLHPQMAREEDIRKRFEREAQVCARVKHENIVDIYSYRADADATFLVMEFVEGESLGDLLKRQGRIEWQVALTMLAGVLKGLAHAHSKGVFHRDIKPDNLLVSQDGRIKITDFGLSTIADSASMTVQDAVVGTPAYLPPEQVSGGKFDHRGDLFSVGVTFYEVLTGSAPFSGQTFSETLKKILTYSPPSPSTFIPEIPQEFDQILAHLLEKQPSKRAGSADGVFEEVKKLAHMKGVELDHATVMDSLHSVENGSASKSVIPLPAMQSGMAKRALPVWALGLTVAMVAIMLFMVPSRSKLVGDGLPKLKESILDASRNIASSVKLRQSKMSRGDFSDGSVLPTPETGKPKSDTHNIPLDNSTKSPPSPAINAHVTVPTTPGQLTLTTRPWAMVTIDNISYGQTPLTGAIELSPGEHLITLNNPEFPTPFTETVNVPSGGTATLDANLWDMVGVVQVLSVKPWAEIVVDGISYGLTPRAKPIIVTFGKHVIELHNPAFKVWSDEIDFQVGSKAVELNVQLEALPE